RKKKRRIKKKNRKRRRKRRRAIRRKRRRKEEMDMPTVIPVCYYGNPANLKTSWSNNNPGRRFFQCKKCGSGFQNP
ncbi:hypothetical protein J1N35_029128, partial [Gossypium stocksii]